jgi:hypothetical protein
MNCSSHTEVEKKITNSETKRDSFSDDYVLSQIRDFFKDSKKVFQLQENSLNNGDTLAYNQVFTNFVMDGRGYEILYISMIMANKWHYPKAFYDTYCILSTECLGSSISNCKNNNRDLAIYFLLKSNELGYYQSKGELQTIFQDANQFPQSREYISKYSNL